MSARPDVKPPALSAIPELKDVAAAAATGRARQDRLVAELGDVRRRINDALAPKDFEAQVRARGIRDAAAAVLGGAAPAAAGAEHIPQPGVTDYKGLCIERELLLVAQREGDRLLDREEKAFSFASGDVVWPQYVKLLGWKVRSAIETAQAEAADRDFRRALAKQGVDVDVALPNLLLPTFGDLRDPWGSGEIHQLIVAAFAVGAIDASDLPRDLDSETRSRALAARADRETELRARKKERP